MAWGGLGATRRSLRHPPPVNGFGMDQSCRPRSSYHGSLAVLDGDCVVAGREGCLLFLRSTAEAPSPLLGHLRAPRRHGDHQPTNPHHDNHGSGPQHTTSRLIPTSSPACSPRSGVYPRSRTSPRCLLGVGLDVETPHHVTDLGERPAQDWRAWRDVCLILTFLNLASPTTNSTDNDPSA